MNKPKKEDYGYEKPGIENEGGWCFEGGEEEYNKALKKWQGKQIIESSKKIRNKL